LPDTVFVEFLQQIVLEAEGGVAKRRRSSVSLREIVGVEPATAAAERKRVHPEPQNSRIAE